MPNLRENQANSSLGRATRAITPSRSHARFSGSAPIPETQRPTPQMSSAYLENINAPATSRDQHSSPVTAHRRGLCPRPPRATGALPQIALHPAPPADTPLAALFWHLLTRGEDYAYGHPMLTQKNSGNSSSPLAPSRKAAATPTRPD